MNKRGNLKPSNSYKCKKKRKSEKPCNSYI